MTPHPPHVDTAQPCRLLVELFKAGWCLADIADAAGCAPGAIRILPAKRWCPQSLADDIQRAHAELIAFPYDPSAPDWVVVLRLVNGERARCTRAERREAIRRMRLAGLSLRQMAERLGRTQKLILRDLAALGLIGAAA